MDYDQHKLLRHLDDPLRLLKWTVDETLILILTPFVGLAIESMTFGIGAAALGFWGLRKIKKSVGVGRLRHAVYWYLPHNTRRLRQTPPSYRREYVG